MSRQPRFRGEDFRGKWSLGAWAEHLILETINNSTEFQAVPYGRSEVGPSSRVEIPNYWSDHLAREVYGKRPDILVFTQERFAQFEQNDQSAGLLYELANHNENEIELIVSQSLLAIEAEASIWQGEKMSDYGRSWAENTGRRKAAKDLKKWTAPTVIVKEEDLQPLLNWQNVYEKPIFIVHLFYDLAFMLDLSQMRKYIEEGIVSAREHEYDQVKKRIFSTYYGLCDIFGEFTELAEVIPFPYQTKGGKFKSALYFEGGRLELNPLVLEKWRALL